MAGHLVGVRCIRGPDWQWGDQDGGIGHVGTIVEPSGPCAQGTVVVVWDYGFQQNYRAGQGGAYDLRMLDNASTGVHHPNSKCDSCSVEPIYGIKWTCSTCQDFDLCSPCYMKRCHELSHKFVRFVDSNCPGELVGDRLSARMSEVFGMFPGAVAVRGKDWKWDNQDGGLGGQGRVTRVHGWKGQTERSVVSVLWQSQVENTYRLGHQGKLDVHCVVPGSGGPKFVSHLPLIGRKIEAVENRFVVGQKVVVAVEMDTLKRLQEGHGGFNAKMMEVMGKRGTVHRITEKGDIRVQYPGHPPNEHRWAINPAALRVIHSLAVGQKVTVTSDREQLAKYHQNHVALENVVGVSGKVTHIAGENSIVVDFGEGKVRTIHQACLEGPPQQIDIEAINARFVKAAAANDMVAIEKSLVGSPAKCGFVMVPDDASICSGLHKAVGKDYVGVVRTILKYRPGLINVPFQDKTPVMTAAHEGHFSLVDLLMTCGGDSSVADACGDRAIHYAAIGRKTDALLTLVNKGADVNATNNKKRTALHIAILNRDEPTAATLLKVGADVNVQDVNGDTPLHVAIIGRDHSLVNLLLENVTNLLICNNRGHNYLHMAALQADPAIIKKILSKDRAIVNIVTRDGLSVLQLAAAASPAALTPLLASPQCDINIQDGRGRTVLHDASARLDVHVTMQVVKNGASVNLQDYAGNTAAHLVLIAKAEVGGVEQPYSNGLVGVVEEKVLEELKAMGLNQRTMTQMVLVCYMVKHGAGLKVTNSHGQTVLDLIEDGRLVEFLERYNRGQEKEDTVGGAAAYVASPVIETPPSASKEAEPEYAEICEQKECRVCSEPGPLVKFEPCGHAEVCGECSVRIKKCLNCKVVISQKKLETGGDINVKTREELKQLEMKFQDLEDQFLCGICMERRRDVAFLCGHGACAQCTAGLEICHMCRTVIQTKIHLY